MSRRQRNRRKFKALWISFLVACGAFFLFDDGPSQQKAFEPLTRASESVTDLWEQTAQLPLSAGLNMAFPQGFQPKWEERTLDHGRIRLRLLQQPYTIGQTEQGLGSEYFAYAASIFNQMAEQVESTPLAQKLRTLSAQADGLGNTLKEAGHLRYEGPPNNGMAHLKTWENLLALVQNVSQGHVTAVAYNEKGQMLEAKQSLTQRTYGESLQAFLDNSRELMNGPDVGQYPETLRLVQAQSKWLERVAANIRLRWDSTRYCPEKCTGHATHIRLYVQQMLPKQEKPKWLAASI